MNRKEDEENFTAHVLSFLHESDRAAVILGTNVLEFLLERILIALLLENSQKRILSFTNMGPLSSFSSKILMAERLSIVSKDLASVLNLIRKIRNEFAHGLGDLSLEEGPIANKITTLVSKLENFDSYHSFPFPKDEEDEEYMNSNAFKFRAAVGSIASLIYNYDYHVPILKAEVRMKLTSNKLIK